MKEIAKCSSCGSNAVPEIVYSSKYVVSCTGCSLFSSVADNEDSAIEMWNRLQWALDDSNLSEDFLYSAYYRFAELMAQHAKELEEYGVTAPEDEVGDLITSLGFMVTRLKLTFTRKEGENSRNNAIDIAVFAMLIHDKLKTMKDKKRKAQ